MGLGCLSTRAAYAAASIALNVTTCAPRGGGRSGNTRTRHKKKKQIESSKRRPVNSFLGVACTVSQSSTEQPVTACD
jgi:hypothetical protein